MAAFSRYCSVFDQECKDLAIISPTLQTQTLDIVREILRNAGETISTEYGNSGTCAWSITTTSGIKVNTDSLSLLILAPEKTPWMESLLEKLEELGFSCHEVPAGVNFT